MQVLPGLSRYQVQALLKELKREGKAHPRGQTRAWSPDGRIVASGSLDRTVRLWDPAAGKEMVILRGHSSAVASLAFIGGGKVLLSSSPDGNLRGWRGGPGSDGTAEPEVMGGEVFSLQFFPDGSWAAVTPNGLFDSSAGADCPRLHGVDGTEVIPINRLRDRHRPGLLSAALMGR